jgi:hypothetical protein
MAIATINVSLQGFSFIIVGALDHSRLCLSTALIKVEAAYRLITARQQEVAPGAHSQYLAWLHGFVWLQIAVRSRTIR